MKNGLVNAFYSSTVLLYMVCSIELLKSGSSGLRPQTIYIGVNLEKSLSKMVFLPYRKQYSLSKTCSTWIVISELTTVTFLLSFSSFKT